MISSPIFKYLKLLQSYSEIYRRQGISSGISHKQWNLSNGFGAEVCFITAQAPAPVSGAKTFKPLWLFVIGTTNISNGYSPGTVNIMILSPFAYDLFLINDKKMQISKNRNQVRQNIKTDIFFITKK